MLPAGRGLGGGARAARRGRRDARRGPGGARLGGRTRRVGDRVPGEDRVRAGARRARRGRAPARAAVRRPELATVQVLADLAGLGARARGAARSGGPARARRGAPQARGRGDVGLARAGRRLPQRRRARRARDRRRQGAADPRQRPRARAAARGERRLLRPRCGRRFDVDAGVLGQVARTRRADDLRAPTPTPGASVWRSSMHAPIELGPRLYGVLSVAHEEPGRFAEHELELLVKLARSSAAAIANAVDFQRERRIARALTLGFVPEPLPDVAGYETGLLYAPAANEPTGGDVYGAWELPGGEVAVLVGDVAGKGVETAALSAMVRFFIEARSWDSARPSRGAGAGQRDAAEPAAARHVRHRLPRRSSPGRAAPTANAGHLPPLHVLRAATLGRCRATGCRSGSTRPRLRRGRAAPGARRPRLRLHRRPDRGAPRRRDVRRRAPDARSSRSARSVLRPDGLVRAVHEEVASWSDGLSDDSVALALRRRP